MSLNVNRKRQVELSMASGSDSSEEKATLNNYALNPSSMLDIRNFLRPMKISFLQHTEAICQYRFRW